MVYRKHTDEVRQRAVELYKLGWELDIITEALEVSERSIRRWEARYDANNGPFTLDYSLCGRRSKLGNLVPEIEALIQEDPTLYRDEFVDWVALTHQVLVAPSTVSRTLLKLGLTRKKLRKTAAQRDEMRRLQWVADVRRMYTSEQFVFIDETGVNNGNLERKYGRSRVGERTIVSTEFAPLGNRYSIIPALTLDGYIAVRMLQETTDGDRFFEFIVEEVLPQMQPFPQPRSVLILDNASIHKGEELQEAVEDAGCVLLFLPPYSPDLNPIEESFSAVKAYLERHGARLLRGPEMEMELFNACMLTVTPNKAREWFANSGYVV